MLTTMGAVLVIASSSRAQPPQNPPAPPVVKTTAAERAFAWQLQSLSEMPPQIVLERFTSYFGEGDYKSAALLVAGADWKSEDLAKLEAVRPHLANLIKWRAVAAGRPEDNLASVDQVTLTAEVGITDGLELSLWHKETVHLRRQPIEGHFLWRIVPGAAEAAHTSGWDFEDHSVVERMAAYLASPLATRNWLAERLTGTRIKELALGVMGYVQDRDKKIPMATNLKKDIGPYVRDEGLFTSPLDAVGTESFSLNANLLGTAFDAIAKPSEVILLYDGQNGQLDFRYQGRAIVALADGHVQFVSPEEAEKLHWKP